jgi:hypothetical protein
VDLHSTNNGYVGGAALLIPAIRKFRNHVEFEKLQCRILKDDDRTRLMYQKTKEHPNKLYSLLYCNEDVEKLTAKGKANEQSQGT